MDNFVVITDSCCDLPVDYINEKEIPYVTLTCNYDGKEYRDDFGKSLSYKKFYEDVRNGSIPKSSQPNGEEYYEVFIKYAAEGKKILYICVSSMLSGAINSANLGKNKVLEEYPTANIYIFDALTASLGQGLMVQKSIELKEKGKSFDEIVEFLEKNKLKCNTYLSLDDLNHVKRGGRISSKAAFLGIVLHIKPVMTVAYDGHIMPVLKIKGRKNVISKLAEIVIERVENPEEQTLAIGHGDCFEEAEKLKTEILKGVQLRVTGKDKDDLQQTIALLKSKDYGIELQFTNYR